MVCCNCALITCFAIYLMESVNWLICTVVHHSEWSPLWTGNRINCRPFKRMRLYYWPMWGSGHFSGIFRFKESWATGDNARTIRGNRNVSPRCHESVDWTQSETTRSSAWLAAAERGNLSPVWMLHIHDMFRSLISFCRYSSDNVWFQWIFYLSDRVYSLVVPQPITQYNTNNQLQFTWAELFRVRVLWVCVCV